MNIVGTEVPVDIEKMKAEIDAMDSKHFYVVKDGILKKYPLPAYGTVEISCQNYKVGRPKYHLSAD